MNNCRSIVDVKELGHLHTIHLRATNIKDITMLSNVHTLDLSYCSMIDDISCLKNVKKLILYGIDKKLIDTSMLSSTIITYSMSTVQNIEVEGNVD